MGYNVRYAIYVANESGARSYWWADESDYADAIAHANREALERRVTGYDGSHRLLVVDRESDEVVHDTCGPECESCGASDAEFRIFGDEREVVFCAECLIADANLPDNTRLLNTMSGEVLTVGALRHVPDNSTPVGSRVVAIYGDRVYTANGKRYRLVEESEYNTMRETVDKWNELE